MSKRQKVVHTVSFAATPTEREIVLKIIERAEQEAIFGGYDFGDRASLEMDLVATHANGCPIDFQRLLDAEQFVFTHDIFGIMRHLDRRSGKLTMCFIPRCAMQYSIAREVANG